MTKHHPVLPDHRPLAIVHRGGNSPQQADRSLSIGVDMLETDIWPFHGRLEVRHSKTIGPIPIYWEKWYIVSWFGKQRVLRDLLTYTPADARLFIDLKGTLPRLGERVVRTIQRIQPGREIVLCGRAWPLLDRVAKTPNVHVFYSVGTEDELSKVWTKLETAPTPAVSINYGLLTEETVARLNALKTTVIAWTVNDPEIAKTLFALGVDGFTSDNYEMLERIVRLRERAFEREEPEELPEEPERKGEE